MNTKLSAIIFAGLLFVACRAQTPAVPVEHITDISVKNTIVHAKVAETLEAQSRGLGGTASLNWDQGMLFLFPEKAQRIFWMKDMLIPIDIIWLSDRTIVGIEKNVPQPLAGVTDDALPQYTSPSTVNNVLEVKAGFADTFGLVVGDVLEFIQ